MIVVKNVEHIPVEKQLLMVLWLLATPDGYRSISDRFNVSKSSLHRGLCKCVKSICSLLNQVVVWPIGECKQAIINGFQQKAGFPGVECAIDGTHILIRTPSTHAASYVNRKSLHSIQLQAVCDNMLCFTHCYCGQPGSVHDARVFRVSSLMTDIANGSIRFEADEHMLGDAGYPLKECLLVPYRDNGNLSDSKQRYNFKHSSTRNAIERAFGLLKGRFRRLKLFDSPDLEIVVHSVLACCMMHNICINEDDESSDVDNDVDDDDFLYQDGRTDLAAGTRKRERITALL
jgi:hypothetical protein